jgi:hypothetical protein
MLPAVQAVLTAGSTGLGVLLVCLWRPDRVRHIPFYSDASHNDPERILLGIGENMACFFMPLVATAEFLHQSRVCAELSCPKPQPPRLLRWMVRCGMKTTDLVRWNFIVTLATTIFFFVTANVPSKRPWTPPHQFSASALILTYALQATLKAILAGTFNNYQAWPESSPRSRNGAARRAWEQWHMLLRLLLAGTLWFALVATWLCYMGRLHAVRMSWILDAARLRRTLSTAMAIIVHFATTACVLLMVVMAVDMRADRLVLASSDAGGSAGAVTDGKGVEYLGVPSGDAL